MFGKSVEFPCSLDQGAKHKLRPKVSQIYNIGGKRKHLGVDGETLWSYFNIIHVQLARKCLIIVKKDVIITRIPA